MFSHHICVLSLSFLRLYILLSHLAGLLLAPFFAFRARVDTGKTSTSRHGVDTGWARGVPSGDHTTYSFFWFFPHILVAAGLLAHRLHTSRLARRASTAAAGDGAGTSSSLLMLLSLPLKNACTALVLALFGTFRSLLPLSNSSSSFFLKQMSFSSRRFLSVPLHSTTATSFHHGSLHTCHLRRFSHELLTRDYTPQRK